VKEGGTGVPTDQQRERAKRKDGASWEKVRPSSSRRDYLCFNTIVSILDYKLDSNSSRAGIFVVSSRFVRSLHCLLSPPATPAQQPTALLPYFTPTPFHFPLDPSPHLFLPSPPPASSFTSSPSLPTHSQAPFPSSTRLLALVSTQQVARLANPLYVSLDSSTALGLSPDEPWKTTSYPLPPEHSCWST
jgi:hypothetical protein